MTPPSTIDPSRPLAELVSARPQLAAELDRLGLDFCCGGTRSLAEAVAAAGLELDGTLARLAAVAEPAAPIDWVGLSLTELVGHLLATHHAYLREALPRLDGLARKVAEVHAANHPELREVQELVVELRADLEPHLLKEERVLFPLVEQLDAAAHLPSFHCGSLRNPIGVMNAEHDRTGTLLAALRERTGGYVAPEDGCASYRALYAGLAELEADTHLHVHKETNLLFPAALDAERILAGAPR